MWFCGHIVDNGAAVDRIDPMTKMSDWTPILFVAPLSMFDRYGTVPRQSGMSLL